jgi:asparagine synthase (glutamine-hydrolysing)
VVLCESSPYLCGTFDPALVMVVDCQIVPVKYKWSQKDRIQVTGHAWINDIFTVNRELAEMVSAKSQSSRDFTNFISELDGQYSFIVEKENEVWLACCHTWSFPLFYAQRTSGLFISDDPGEILPLLRVAKIKEDNKAYFLNFGVTPASETLVMGINQVRPGQIVRFSLMTGIMEAFVSRLKKGKSPAQSEHDTSSTIHRIFDKYSNHLKTQKVLVPLTSGYDSRLIACLLKATGQKNVICATWGRQENSEWKTAERVAKTLGFPYMFIPTDNQSVSKYLHDEEFAKYIAWAGHFSSMPYLQDYFAVRFLKETSVIDEETIVLPGHPGDFLRGSHLYRDILKQNKGRVADNIINIFGTSFPLNRKERRSILEIIIKDFFSGEVHPSVNEQYESWDFEERQCKFIGNSSQVYNFFGINCLMPLFDKELLTYFLSLPLEQRLGASLYNKTLENRIFKTHGCDFDLKPAENEMNQGSKWKNFLLQWLPRWAKEWYYPVNDDAFYREITRELMQSDPANHYRKPVKSHYYNCYLTQWYRYRVEKQLQ